MAENIAGIESALLADSQVHQAKVVESDGRLVAYVVPEQTADDPEMRAAFVDSWQAVFENTYEAENSDERAGWDDSFTVRPIAPAQMREWADTTVARIQSLNPAKVLEIGAGSGLIMRPLLEAGGIERYVATDFSATAVRLLEQLVDEFPTTEIVVAKAEASEAATVVAGSYDTIVVNSVAQYFPSLRYLEKVLETALPVVAPGGHIILGDLRNAALLEAFFALKRHLRRDQGTSDELVREEIAHELKSDGELSIDPAWLAQAVTLFDRVSQVEIVPRRGDSANEMTLFRYDAVLHVDCAAEPEEIPTESGDRLAMRALERRLAAGDRPFGYHRVANERLDEAVEVRDNYGFTPADAQAPQGVAVDPEALWRLGERYGWLVRISWADGDRHGAFDVSFLPPEAAARSHFRSADPVGRGAIRGTTVMFPPRLEHAFTHRLRTTLAERLPESLVPNDFVFLTGMLDADALPAPRPGFVAAQVGAGTDTGSTVDLVLAAFHRHLSRATCGPDDNFFAVGGESFTAAMCVRDLREQGLTVSVRDLFECKTARQLAKRLDDVTTNG